jgi:aspartate aminotransferase
MEPSASGHRVDPVVDTPFDPFRYAHEHRTEVAWLSQNTNHLVPPEVVQPALLAAIRERLYEGYPLGSGQIGLKELVLADLGLPSDTPTIISAGATEALYMTLRGLLHPGDVVLASDPSYLIIHKFIQLSGASTRDLDIYAPPYRLTADRLREAVTPQTRMVLLIDPLNPLGSGYSKEEVRAIAEVAHDHRLYLLHDVTYRDFAEQHTLAQGFYPEGTVTAWSVSKNCGLAGMRLGGMVGPTDLIKEALRYNTNDLGVNVLAQVADRKSVV